MKNKKFLFSLLIAHCLLLIALSGCQRIREAYGRANGAETETQAASAPVFAVNTTFAVQGPIQDYLALSGDIVASSTVDVFSETAGRVTEVYVSVGQRVTRGQNIAAVDPARPGMDFNLSMATAPISGTVISVPARAGQMVTAVAPPLARISGNGGLEIRLNVAERFISRISLNQPCEIVLDAWPGEVFRGSVSEMSPTVDTMTRTMEIKVAVENPGARLRPGMFARVRIVTERREDVVKIPVGAVVNRFGEQYIFVVNTSNPESPFAQRRDIVPGIIIDGVMEVSEGLAPNEEIVIRGMSLLEDGLHINIIDRSAPLSAN